MRVRDDNKKDALFEATVKLVNEIGFASSSVSKIAKEAGVSPATIYVYYENKEELLVSAYVEIKRKMSRAILKDFDTSLPIRDIIKNACHNIFEFASKNGEYFKYTEQFANSPFSALVNRAEVDQYFEPLFQVLQRGIDRKILKDVNLDILSMYIWVPIVGLASARLCGKVPVDSESFDQAFTLTWDAIKL